MRLDLLSRSFGERFNLRPRRITDNFLRVSAVALLPLWALLIFLLVSSETGGSFLPFLPLTSEAFWLAVIILTLPTAYGPRSLWRAIWYSWANLPRSSKWPERFHIFIHSLNVNLNPIPRRLARHLWLLYLSRGDGICECGIVNTSHVLGCKWPCSCETLYGRALLAQGRVI